MNTPDSAANTAKPYAQAPFNTHGIQRLSLVTDAWQPQVNGVVTTLSQLVAHLRQQGIEVDVIHPNDYDCVPLPTYPEIPLVWRAHGLEKRLLDFQPNAIHIATEGALGWKARRIARKHGLPFTTAYHTKYPEYIHERFPVPTDWVYKIMRRFHTPAQNTFCSGRIHFNGVAKPSFSTRSADDARRGYRNIQPNPRPDFQRRHTDVPLRRTHCAGKKPRRFFGFRVARPQGGGRQRAGLGKTPADLPRR